ncbi:MAG TPA: secretin N-terminal domain-containing protein [Vicinamibacterales bacterium]|nr:secretin N-terminal domain-containing protein [Vicinamibacterales bacterium]
MRSVVMLALVAVTAAGCATGRAFARGEAAGQAGDWESAVGFYRQALDNDPDRPDYKIALERAMVAASGMYAERARQFEAAGQLEEALRAYRKAQEFEPSNRQLSAKGAEIERTLRDRIEAAVPRPEIEKLRQQARRATTEPILSPSNPEPLIVNFVNTSIRDILTFVGNYSGINVTFDRDFQDRTITLKLEGVSLEQALQQIMIANQLFYRVLNDRTIIVAADNTQKRTQYEEQVIRTFFISHADATELSTLLVALVRVAGMAIQPQIVANKTTNTLTVRATAPVVAIVERVIEANDKPRAEVMVDVQILEVSRERAKRYGLDLGTYSAALAFSPEAAPAAEGKPFNLNTISQGISTADFYLSVPSAVIRFLESDSQTKVLAKPNLRGAEGQKLSLNLGEDVPIPSTTFTPLAGTTGPGTSPLTSFGYRTIGIIVEMTPRVTYDGDIILELTLENSARGQDSNIAGQNLPSFFSRKVTTKLRLRDGESNLLAGLLREDERRSLTGFPGVMRLPIVRQLFSNNDSTIKQTDIVMLLTPRIIRTHDLRAQDLSPIYIGTQSNMSLTGPPATILGPAEPDAAAQQPPAAAGATPALGTPTSPTAAPVAPPSAPQPSTQPAAAPVLPGGAPRPVVPPGSSPIPGMVPSPTAPIGAPPSNVVVFPPPPEAATPVPPAPAVPAPAPAPGAGSAQNPPSAPARVTLSPPNEMRVGSGPYTIPISVAGATRVSTMTLSITYNPALVRIRNVQEGTFMRQGGATPAFSSQIDDKSGRIDIVITRLGDKTGASTGGLLAALLVEPLTAGTGALGVSGSASIPGGDAAALQFFPAGITVR